MASELKKWWVGKMFWVNDELYVVTRLGQSADANGNIPADVELVTW
jgi:hypothetical protein